MKESRIQYEICQYLQEHDYFFHSVPNEAPGNNKVRAMQMVAMGMRSGVADMVVWLKNKRGIIAYIEVKNETGKLSPKQIKFRDKCVEYGVPYCTARSVADVDDFLRSVDC